MGNKINSILMHLFTMELFIEFQKQQIASEEFNME